MKKKEPSKKGYVKGGLSKPRWFCKKHGLEGAVGKDWCFGCYRLDEDTEMPVPYIGYGVRNHEDCRVCGSIEHSWCGNNPAKPA